MSLYFITGSKYKFEEVQALIPDIKQLDIELPEIQEINAQKIVSAKLQEAFSHHNGEFIVEDTSLHLDCLNGLPGPLIKWFVKTLGNKGLYKITEKMGNGKAVAKTIVGFAKDKKHIYFFTGEVKGSIVSPRGNNKFGWNNIFKPVGFNKTFAQMPQEEKNLISMRGLAIKKLKKFLKKT